MFAKNAKLDKQGLVDTSHIYRGTLEGKSAENKMQYFDMVLRSINFWVWFLYSYYENSQSEDCIQYIKCSDWMIVGYETRTRKFLWPFDLNFQ